MPSIVTNIPVYKPRKPNFDTTFRTVPTIVFVCLSDVPAIKARVISMGYVAIVADAPAIDPFIFQYFCLRFIFPFFFGFFCVFSEFHKTNQATKNKINDVKSNKNL